jgi:hypothetical protein
VSETGTPLRYRRGGMNPIGPACEICTKTAHLVADHCHRHGLLRGTLCAMCNHYMSYIDLGKPFTGVEPWLRPRAALLVENWHKCVECATTMPAPVPVFRPPVFRRPAP